MESLFIRNEPFEDESGGIAWRVKGIQVTNAEAYLHNGVLKFDKALPSSVKGNAELLETILGQELAAALLKIESLEAEKQSIQNACDAFERKFLDGEASKTSAIEAAKQAGRDEVIAEWEASLNE